MLKGWRRFEVSFPSESIYYTEGTEVHRVIEKKTVGCSGFTIPTPLTVDFKSTVTILSDCKSERAYVLPINITGRLRCIGLFINHSIPCVDAI